MEGNTRARSEAPWVGGAGLLTVLGGASFAKSKINYVCRTSRVFANLIYFSSAESFSFQFCRITHIIVIKKFFSRAISLNTFMHILLYGIDSAEEANETRILHYCMGRTEGRIQQAGSQALYQGPGITEVLKCATNPLRKPLA